MSLRQKTYTISDKLSLLKEAAVDYHIPDINPLDKASLSIEGLATDCLLSIMMNYGWNKAQLARLLDISEKTLRNRLNQKDVLKTYETDLALNLMELYHLGVETFDNRDNFLKWLDTQWEFMNFKKPKELLNTVSGINFISDKLLSIQAGVFA